MQIVIQISEEEKQEVLKLMERLQGIQISVDRIAFEGELNPNRTRFVIEDLINEGRLIRNVLKDYGPHFRRYSYELPKETIS